MPFWERSLQAAEAPNDGAASANLGVRFVFHASAA
jgi:hypothetical protein